MRGHYLRHHGFIDKFGSECEHCKEVKYYKDEAYKDHYHCRCDINDRMGVVCGHPHYFCSLPYIVEEDIDFIDKVLTDEEWNSLIREGHYAYFSSSRDSPRDCLRTFSSFSAPNCAIEDSFKYGKSIVCKYIDYVTNGYPYKDCKYYCKDNNTCDHPIHCGVFIRCSPVSSSFIRDFCKQEYKQDCSRLNGGLRE